MRTGQTTSSGLWRFARDYAVAADAAQKAAGDRFSHPVYFLHGRSIELALKAFLVARGTPYKTLKFRPYGHDIMMLLKEARRRRLGQFVKLGRAELLSLKHLNDEYSAKNYEYIVTGSFVAPGLIGLTLITWSLVTSLERFCINAAYPDSST